MEVVSKNVTLLCRMWGGRVGEAKMSPVFCGELEKYLQFLRGGMKKIIFNMLKHKHK